MTRRDPPTVEEFAELVSDFRNMYWNRRMERKLDESHRNN